MALRGLRVAFRLVMNCRKYAKALAGDSAVMIGAGLEELFRCGPAESRLPGSPRLTCGHPALGCLVALLGLSSARLGLSKCRRRLRTVLPYYECPRR